jgi:hypothetical protein
LLENGQVLEAGAPAELANSNSALARHFGDFLPGKTVVI